MPGTNRVYIQVDIGSEDAQKQIDALNQKISTIGTSTAKASAQGTSGLRSFSVAVEQTNNSLNAMANAIAGLAVTRLAVQMFQAGDALSKLQISFKAMTSSAQEANQVWGQLVDIAAKRPFSLEEIAGAAQKLRAFGVAAKEVGSDIEAITGFGASRAWTTEQLDTVIHGLGMMREKGIAQARELFRQMAAQGLDVMQIIKDNEREATGKILDEETIRKLMEKGQIAGKAMFDALIEAMRKGAKEEQIGNIMQLVTVQFQKLGDEWEKLSQKIAQDIAPQFKGFFTDIKDFLKKLEDDPALRHQIEWWIVWGTKIAIVATALIGLSKILSAIYGTLKAIQALEVLKWMFTIDAAKIGGVMDTILSKIGTLIGLLATPLGALSAGGVLGLLLGNKLAEQDIQSAQAQGKVRQDIGGGKTLRVGTIPPNPLMDALNALPLGTAQRPGSQRIPTSLITPNQELIESQLQEAQAVLARAREEELKGIAAVEIRYDQIRATMLAAAAKEDQGVPAKALADVEQARQISIQHVIEESQAKQREQEYNATKLRYENEIALAKDRYSQEAEMALAVVKDTPAAEARAQVERLQIIQRGADEVRQLERDRADAEFQYQAGIVTREAGQQMIAMKDHADARQAIAKKATDDITALDAIRREAQQKADIEAAKETQKAIADIVKQAADQTSEHLKAAQDARDNATIAHAERQIEIQRTMIEQGDAQTARDKYNQIEKATQFEIAAAQEVQRVRDQIAQEHLQEELDSIQILMDAFPEHAAQLRALMAAAQDQYDAERYGAESELADKTVKLWLDAQKQVNEAWIEEQKQIFDKFESTVGQLFDALFEKGKSFGRRMLDMLTGMGKDALKALIVPNLSAALMTAMGMPVTIQHHDYGTSPLGQMASLFSGKPVFGAAPQLPHPNLLDVKPVGPGGYAPYRVPVDMGNIPLKIDLHQTGRETVTVQPEGGGGGGGEGLVTAVSHAISFPTVEGGESYTTSGSITGGGGVAGAGGSSWLGNIFNTGGGFGYGGGGVSYSGAGGGGGGGGGFNFADLLNITAPAGGGGGGGGGGAGLGSTLSAKNLLGLASIGKTVSGWFAGSGGLVNATPMAGGAGLGGWGIAGPTWNLTPAGAQALGGMAVGLGIAGVQGSYSLGQFMQNRNVSAPVRGLTAGALGAFSGALTAGGLMALFPVLAAAGPIGIAVGAAIGLGIALMGAFKQTDQAHARDLVKRMYGIDISNVSILNQIVAIAKQNFGGQIDMAVASPQVQQLVALYSAATGQGMGRLPRPMYPATFAQGAGGLQLQPTYSNGQMVTSPYSGMTTTTWANYQSLYNAPMSGLYLQLDPNLAQQLFAGNVINVLNNNPTAVGNANAGSVVAGNTRSQQLGGLLEPSTVMA